MLLKVRQEIKLLFIIQEHFGYSSKVKLEIKSCLEFLINNSFFQVGCKIFFQVIGIPMGSNPAPCFANFLLFFYKFRWLKSSKNTNYGVAIKFGNIFRFIDNLIAINYGNEFENHYSEIYPLELILKN